MQLTTSIDIPKSSFLISQNHSVMLLGSCFADNVGEKFTRGGFNSLVNPFGTLYNPASISILINQCIDNKNYNSESPYIFCDSSSVWHSWLHHSKFSSSSQMELLNNVNDAFARSSDFLRHADVLIITLGTSIIYKLLESGMTVANCHKQLDSMFIRERLDAKTISNMLSDVMKSLHEINPNVKVIFTVSPIRHKRDGMHVNNISKGILLQAVDELISFNQDSSLVMQYFPSYEIMLDELRDYRFYADDMIHPSPLAVEYIWQRFQDTYFDKNTQEYVRIKNKEWARGQHRKIVID